MQPGVYSSLSNHEYHHGEGISKSQLDLIARSPLHLRHVLTAANDRAPTAAQAIGTAVHALVLEPDAFAREYALTPKFDRRTKDGKAAAEAWSLENAGKTALDADDWALVHAMRDAVMGHAAAGALLSAPGKAEQSVYWSDPVSGVLCRCRPDFWRDDGIVVDLKTTEDASPEAFARSMAEYRYHVQEAFYTDGITAATRQAPKAFLFVAVEKKAPHAVAVYQLSPESVELGRLQYRQALDAYAECQRTGKWAGYGDRIQPINLPAWFISRNAGLLGAA